MPSAAPHLDRPICEPVALPAGGRLRLRRVAEGASAGATAPFPHYHDVCELVLFGRVAGALLVDGLRYPLRRGSVAFVPSLRQHDFDLQAGPRDWTLVQIGADACEALVVGNPALANAFCVRPVGTARARIDALRDWLLDAGEAGAESAALVQLLLHAAADAPRVRGEPCGPDPDALRRLRPAIEALRRDPAHAPSAEGAAALCALSPGYFSRRFHQQLGMAWSDYVRTHRLHLASQMLLESELSAAAIAEALGFATASHFGELFRKRFGMTPDAYRRAGAR